MPDDLPIVATYRMPVLGRSSRATPDRVAIESVSAAHLLRAVPPGSMRPIDTGTPAYGRRYLAHAGRAWTTLHPRSTGGLIRWSAPADLAEARTILSRGGSEMLLHGLHPSPFASLSMGMRPLAVAEGYPGGPEALRAPVADRVADMFARDIVHDGTHVYVATRPPVVVLRRGRTGDWSHSVGPSRPYDPYNEEIAFCVRQAERFAPGLRDIGRGFAREVLRGARDQARRFAHLPPDDADLADLANAASVGALWLARRLRRSPDPGTSAGEAFAGRLQAVRRRAALGMYGAIPAAEHPAAVEEAVRLVRDLAGANRRSAVAPDMQAFLSYADLVALPRIAEAKAAPEVDIEGLSALAP